MADIESTAMTALTADAAGSRRRHHRNYQSFSTFLYKLLKSVTSDVGITRESMTTVDTFVIDQVHRLTNEASKLARINGRATITTREVSTATQLILSSCGDLCRYAISAGNEAALKFKLPTEGAEASKSAAKKAGGDAAGAAGGKVAGNKPVPKSIKAGLFLPVGRIYKIMKQDHRAGTRVSISAAVFLCGVVEYLVSEWLELAGTEASQDNRHRIVPRSLRQAIERDADMKRLMHGAILPGSGVPSALTLLPAARQSKKAPGLGLAATNRTAVGSIGGQSKKLHAATAVKKLKAAAVSDAIARKAAADAAAGAAKKKKATTPAAGKSNAKRAAAAAAAATDSD